MSDYLAKIPVMAKTQAARELEEGSMLVVDCENSSYRMLNAAGSFLWRQMDGSRSLDALAELLCEEFEVDKEQALKDTVAFFDQMTERKTVAWQ